MSSAFQFGGLPSVLHSSSPESSEVSSLSLDHTFVASHHLGACNTWATQRVLTVWRGRPCRNTAPRQMPDVPSAVCEYLKTLF